MYSYKEIYDSLDALINIIGAKYLRAEDLETSSTRFKQDWNIDLLRGYGMCTSPTCISTFILDAARSDSTILIRYHLE